MGEIRSLRRVGVRTLVYTLVVSSIAVMVSLAIVNLLRPGEGVDHAIARELLAGASEGARAIVRQSGENASGIDRKSTRLNSSNQCATRMPSISLNKKTH